MSEECCQIKITRAGDSLRIEFPGKHSGADVSGCNISVRRASEEGSSECAKEDQGHGGPKDCC